MTLIGITEEDMQLLITNAYKEGWKACAQSDWLEGRDAIIDYLSRGMGGKRMSMRTYRDHLARGHFGEAVQDDGTYARARKSQLDIVWREYLTRKVCR